MAGQELHVFMDGRLCGVLRQSSTGDLRFRYDDEYRADPNATPLSLSMRPALAEHRKKAVLPFLEGLLSDNERARRALARRYRVSEGSVFGLLAHIGVDVAGALQIVPDLEIVPDRDEVRGRWEVLSRGRVADLLDAVLVEFRDGRSVADGAGRFSLAGAQPKVALLHTEQGEWARPVGATPTTHILKPVMGTFRRLDLVEHMTMRAAAHLGLDVARSRIEVFGSIPTFVTTRYDRRRVDGVWHRLHQEDLAQALSVTPSKKYQHDDGGPGVGRVAQLMKSLPRPDDRIAAAEKFFAGLMFNVVAQCTDAHAKNYALMLDGSAVRLAPLYDLATFAPYASPDRPPASAMKIGDQYEFKAIGPRHCLRAAATLGLHEDRATEVLDRLRGGMAAAFETARAELVDVDEAGATFADEVVDRVSRLPLVRPS